MIEFGLENGNVSVNLGAELFNLWVLHPLAVHEKIGGKQRHRNLLQRYLQPLTMRILLLLHRWTQPRVSAGDQRQRTKDEWKAKA